jgi:hypothetical protein
MDTAEYMKQSSRLSNYGRYVTSMPLLNISFESHLQLHYVWQHCNLVDLKLPFSTLALNIPI